MWSLATDEGQQPVVGGGAHDVGEPIGPPLCRRPEVLGTGRNQEGFEGGTKQRGRLGIEKSLDGSHPVQQRGERQVSALKLPLALGKCAVGVGDKSQMAPGGAHVTDGADGRDVGQDGDRLVLLGFRTNRTARSMERRWS